MGLSSRDESLPVPHRVEISVRLLIVTLVSKTVSATNETSTAWRMHWLGTVDAILLGRLTCDLFASLWSTVDPAVGATAGPRAALPKRVWGPRARRVGEGHAEVLRGGAQAATTVVPLRYPSTVVWGSPQLFEALLVDRLRLLVAPVLPRPRPKSGERSRAHAIEHGVSRKDVEHLFARVDGGFPSLSASKLVRKTVSRSTASGTSAKGRFPR